MSRIRAVRTEADYQAALARIDALMDAGPDTPEGEELDVLTDLVELYESRHILMGYPSPLGAIRFRMEQGGLSPRDLIPFLGSRAKVSEVLAGKRPLTLQMVRALHANLGIPAEVLLRQQGDERPSAPEGSEWRRFPLAEMARREWIPKRPNLPDHAEEVMRDLIRRAGGEHVMPETLCRKNDPACAGASMDSYALKAWCWEALARANATELRAAYKPGTVDREFLRRVARLSWSQDGPHLAKEFLAQNGIHLVCVAPLPRASFDGAALRLADGTP
jgi:HTH-type transcriptional regulator/antitoxin HigA